MKQVNPFASDTMLMTVAVWMCTVPLVSFILLTGFGIKIASLVALMLSLLIFGICWGICGWKVFRE
jgi:hypothetical protein